MPGVAVHRAEQIFRADPVRVGRCFLQQRIAGGGVLHTLIPADQRRLFSFERDSRIDRYGPPSARPSGGIVQKKTPGGIGRGWGRTKERIVAIVFRSEPLELLAFRGVAVEGLYAVGRHSLLLFRIGN